MPPLSATYTGPRLRRPARGDRPPARLTTDVLREAVAQLSPLGEPFHLADLVLAAWRLDPDRFGLEGYERQFPDSKRVSAEVCDRRKGRVGRELERVGPNVFRAAVGGGR